MDKFGVGSAVGGFASPPNPLKQPTPFDTVASTLASARALATRVEHMVDSLLGEVPVAANTVGENPQPLGCLHQLADEALRTEKYLDEANAALARIEAVLP